MKTKSFFDLAMKHNPKAKAFIRDVAASYLLDEDDVIDVMRHVHEHHEISLFDMIEDGGHQNLHMALWRRREGELLA